MKKKFLQAIAIISGIVYSFTVNTAVANSRVQEKTNLHALQKSDTPYLATARIARTGTIDTPYTFVSAAPAEIYREVETAIAGEKGIFKIELTFYSERGMIMRRTQYFIHSE